MFKTSRLLTRVTTSHDKGPFVPALSFRTTREPGPEPDATPYRYSACRQPLLPESALAHHPQSPLAQKDVVCCRFLIWMELDGRPSWLGNWVAQSDLHEVLEGKGAWGPVAEGEFEHRSSVYEMPGQ
jgi:hypothetical protein